MAGHCPACFIRLPLSGEPNCDCEPPTMRQTGRSGDYSHSEPFGALPDARDVERVCEPRQTDPRRTP